MENTNPYQTPEAALHADSNQQQFYEPKIFALNGRIGRIQYIVYNFVTGIVLTFLAAIVFGLGVLISGGEPPVFATILAFGIYASIIAYTFILARRRLNDLNRTGWLSLLIIIPVVNLLFVLYLWFARGNEGENAYGLPSKKSLGALSLLVVLFLGTAIIGILAAIALPAYQDYTERAAQSQTQKIL